MHFLPVALLAFASPTLSARLTISVSPSSALPNPSTLPPTTLATLHSHGVPSTAYITRNSNFIFPHLAPGSYLFTAHSRDVVFEPLRVDVVAHGNGSEVVDVWQTFRGNEWGNKGEKRCEEAPVTREGGVQEWRAHVNVLGSKEYYQAREGFNVVGFLKSPMILMALFSLGMIVGVPYMMENMDPETYKEFQEIQKESAIGKAGNPAGQLQNFDMAGWLAGAKTDAGAGSGSGSGSGGSKRK